METQDTITVAPTVLITIARHAALGVTGVARMGNTPGGMGRILKRTPLAEGVRLDVENNSALIELYVILQAGSNMRATCRKVQHEVTRNLEEIVGLDVVAVNVHIEDVAFDAATGDV